MKFEQIKSLDDKYIMHTYGRYPVALDKGKNATVYDVDGKKYIDVSSGIGVNALGYCDDGWINAVSAQLSKIQHMSNYYYSEPTVKLAEKLCTLSGMSKVFFGNSGAEANECAIKTARKYSFDKYGKGRDEIITLCNSFHGRTITTLAATGQDFFHSYFFPFTEGFKYVPADDITALEKNVDGKTCAVMVECIQGEGGVNIVSGEYLKAVERLCAEKDVLLIIDEVQTGIARTGKLFSYMHYGLSPDLVTVAKGLGGGLPIGGCLCNEKLSKVLGASMHGTTFGGNPAVCAGALEVLSRISDSAFLKEVTAKGEYIAEKCRKIKNVKSVRNIGMMIGIEIENITAKDAAAVCVKNGLLIITAKELLRMLPPLTITYAEIDEAVSILEKTLSEVN